MLTRNELEVVRVLVFVVVFLACLSPITPAIAIVPIWFWHPLDVPIHEKFKRAEIQDLGVQASEPVCVNVRN